MTSVVRNLGDTFEREDKTWRVIRICHSYALHEEGGNLAKVVEESYLELKGQDGSIDFEVLVHNETAYEGPSSTIQAPAPLNWKGER